MINNNSHYLFIYQLKLCKITVIDNNFCFKTSKKCIKLQYAVQQQKYFLKFLA